MKVCLLLAIFIAVFCYCVAKKHHKKDKNKDLNEYKRPSANPYHHGHKTGRLRGQHIQFKKHKKGYGDLKSVHDSDWMSAPISKDCKKKCEAGEFCIANKHTREEKCVNLKKFKEGRKLFRKYHKRKESLKDDMKGVDQKLLDMKKDLMTVEHMRDVYDLMEHYKKEPISKPKMLKHDMQVKPAEIVEAKSLKEARSFSTDECRPREMYELKKRLTGYFVLIHTESRQKHHRKNHHSHFGKHHKGGHKSLKKDLKSIHDVHIETESHGHCKCSKSIMWEFHKQDVNDDGHLTHDELATMEGNMREPCMKPLFKSCDKDKDGRLAHGEWCCCLADTVAPCAEKKRLTDIKADWVPRCDKEGYFERAQCHEKSKYCWCVDLNGNMIPETKKYGSAHCGKYDPNGKLIKP